MTGQHTIQHSPRRRVRHLLWTSGALLLTLATFASIVVAGVVATDRTLHQPVPATSVHASRTAYAEPASPTGNVTVHHGRRLVAAFVVGKSGTIASDLLAPYDIFASSPAFTTYVVGAGAGPAPLEGGPAVVPTYTFDDVDAHPALTPDLVVVPGLTKPTGSTEAALRTWVTRQHDDGAKVLVVCSGALVLAETGMLDGLHATSHWSRIHALETSRPAVHWVRGRRWVEDGSVTTTAAVTSGVPAALHLVAELAGPAEAQRVANLHPELGWTPTETTTIPDDHFAAHDWPVGLNYVLPWFRPTIGIALPDGVGELDATAAFEVYGQSAAARTVAIATSDTVRTRHGLTLLTTSTSKAPDLDRLVIPGTAETDAVEPRLLEWAHKRGLTVEPLVDRSRPDGSRGGGGGFTAALQDLADHTDAATTRTTAKMIGYPTTDLDLHNGHRTWRTVLLALVSLALAVLIGGAPARLARRRRRRAHTSGSTPATKPTVDSTTEADPSVNVSA
jgi:transcriptional regulator GlxA family with amidase domain